MASQQANIDSVYLPLRDGGVSPLDVQLPQYYRENFFSDDTLYHAELPGGKFGVAGKPVPNSLYSDNLVAVMMLVFFLLMVIALSSIHEFVSHQLKRFFLPTHDGGVEVNETGSELRIQMFLVLVNGLLIALLVYFYTINTIGDSFVLSSPYYLLAIYAGLLIAYFLLKGLLYVIVNTVLFGGKKSQQWIRLLILITALEGILLLPAVFFQAYFGMTEQNVIVYFTVVLIFVKILTFFKCYAVFFRTNVVKLQIILYFCALEMIPLLALWSALDFAANSLKIIF